MGPEETTLLRLGREKRGELEPEDLSGNLIVQLVSVTERSEPTVVRAQHRPSGRRGSEAVVSSGKALDGSDPGNPARSPLI
jgi:hypothetical protein